MTDTLTAPSPEAAVAAPETLTPAEALSIATPEPGSIEPSSISEASKALREKALAQPRNPDGTFTNPDAPAAEPVEGAAPAPASQPEGEVAAPEPEPASEPAVFVLKGDPQRGESDIELDITGLPPEVVARLELSESRGMKRKEYDAAMSRVQALETEIEAGRTELAVDPIGTVLKYAPPAMQAQMGEVLLLEHWNELAPVIEALWQDEAGRMRRLQDIRTGVQSRRGEVATTVQATRAATAVKSAVASLVPETADESTAAEFYATSIALLQNALSRGESVAPDSVPHLLAAHRRRFFAADAGAPANTPPARPKLAVKPSKASAAVAAPSPTTVLSQDAVRAQTLARSAALATAHGGAGASAVQRPGPGPNATVKEASAFLRGQLAR